MNKTIQKPSFCQPDLAQQLAGQQGHRHQGLVRRRRVGDPLRKITTLHYGNELNQRTIYAHVRRVVGSGFIYIYLFIYLFLKKMVHKPLKALDEFSKSPFISGLSALSYV